MTPGTKTAPYWTYRINLQPAGPTTYDSRLWIAKMTAARTMFSAAEMAKPINNSLAIPPHDVPRCLITAGSSELLCSAQYRLPNGHYANRDGLELRTLLSPAN